MARGGGWLTGHKNLFGRLDFQGDFEEKDFQEVHLLS